MLSPEQKERYLRQILALDEKTQEIIRQKKVLIVGAGGLGSPLELYLVAAGIGELILFEADKVSLSNLGRQILYQTADVGHSKAQLAKTKLERLNPDVKITVVEEFMTFENASQYIQGVDYLVDASDNFETKFLINDLGIKYNIPFTIAGIEGFEGQLISCIPHKTACYRCIFTEPPPTDKSRPIAVVGPVCGVMGSLQAMEVLKGLINNGTRVLNTLLLVSLRDGEFTKLPIKPNPKCSCQVGVNNSSKISVEGSNATES
jgi:molybdopterin/thiamine biosynthesis adenylyltransferase